jgi:hypothetical protein
LQALQCPEFDAAYAQSIIEQNNVIIAVTEVGMQRASDRNLRNLSGDIRARLMAANDKTATRFGVCAPLPTNSAKTQGILAGLCAQGECFDVVYARTLSELVRQSGAANTLAASRAANATLNRQGGFMAGLESDWGSRLDRWVVAHGCCPTA